MNHEKFKLVKRLILEIGFRHCGGDFYSGAKYMSNIDPMFRITFKKTKRNKRKNYPGGVLMRITTKTNSFYGNGLRIDHVEDAHDLILAIQKELENILLREILWSNNQFYGVNNREQYIEKSNGIFSTIEKKMEEYSEMLVLNP